MCINLNALQHLTEVCCLIVKATRVGRVETYFFKRNSNAGLPNLFTGTGHNCGRKAIAGHINFYQDFLTRNSSLFIAALTAKTKKKGLRQNFRPFFSRIDGKDQL